MIAALLAVGPISAQTITYNFAIGSGYSVPPSGGINQATFSVDRNAAFVPSLGNSFNVDIIFGNPTSGALWDSNGAIGLDDDVDSAVVSFAAFPSVPGYDTTWEFFFTGQGKSVTDPDTFTYTGSDQLLTNGQFVGTPDAFLFDEGSTTETSAIRFSIYFTPTVPEPSGSLLVALGLVGACFKRTRC